MGFLLRIFFFSLFFSLFFLFSLLYFSFNCVKWKIPLMRLQFIGKERESGRPFYGIFGLKIINKKFINWKIMINAWFLNLSFCINFANHAHTMHTQWRQLIVLEALKISFKLHVVFNLIKTHVVWCLIKNTCSFVLNQNTCSFCT